MGRVVSQDRLGTLKAGFAVGSVAIPPKPPVVLAQSRCLVNSYGIKMLWGRVWTLDEKDEAWLKNAPLFQETSWKCKLLSQ